MTLAFDNGLSNEYDALEARYAVIMEAALQLTGKPRNYEVDVSLVDEPTIQQINRDYRHIDKVTDVISFAFEDDESEIGIIHDDEHDKLLGEIFICVPRALMQAKEIGNTDERELRFLFAHGMLHLLGYDHMSKEEEEIMFPLQERVLAKAEEMEQQHGQ